MLYEEDIKKFERVPDQVVAQWEVVQPLVAQVVPGLQGPHQGMLLTSRNFSMSYKYFIGGCQVMVAKSVEM